MNLRPTQLVPARRVAAALLGGAVLIIETGCSSGSSNANTSGSCTVTVGAIISQTGQYGPFAPSGVAAIDVAADELNGPGLDGVKGVKIGNTVCKWKWDLLDDRSLPEDAVTDATQLIRDDHVHIIFGPLANAALAVAPLAAANNVIQISTATSTAALEGNSKFPLLFGGKPDNQYVASSAIAAIQHFYPNAKKVALFWPNDAGNQSLGPYVTAFAAASGMNLMNFSYPPGTTDLSTVALQVKDFDPDVVIAGTSPQETANVLGFLNTVGVPLSIPVFTNAGAPSTPSASGGRPTILLLQNPVDLTVPNSSLSPSMAALQNALLAKAAANGTPITASQLTVLQFYDLVALVAKAMEVAGTSTDTAKIAAAMRQVSVIGLGDTKIHYNASDEMSEQFLASYYSSSTAAPVTVVLPST